LQQQQQQHSIIIMRWRGAALAVAVLLAVSCSHCAHAYKVHVAPGKTECIQETMNAAHFEVRAFVS
jgi:hypothetical protein